MKQGVGEEAKRVKQASPRSANVSEGPSPLRSLEGASAFWQVKLRAVKRHRIHHPLLQ